MAVESPGEPAGWELRDRVLRPAGRPLVMGVLNVTPDSFSDGGLHATVEAAVAHAARLLADGADILDVGGESTRPGADRVDAETEIARVVPVVRAVAAADPKAVLSVDTSKAAVAGAAIEAGAAIVNDVTGLTGDPDMPAVCRDADVGVCVMHMRGTPRTMQDRPRYEDVVAEVADYLRRRVQVLVEFGIPAGRICVDPGVGFGKTTAHNLAILREVAAFRRIGRPVLIGHSRKRFLGELTGRPTDERLAATVGVACAVAAQGAEVLRVHDVREVVDALTTFAATSAR